MGKTLEALLHLQFMQRQLVQVQKRLRFQKHAVTAQEKKIQHLQDQYDRLHEKSLRRRSDADRLELDLKIREEQVQKLRAALNTTKTNKEYASILTQINSTKADNAKLEESALKLMQEADEIHAEARDLQQQIDQEHKSQEKIRAHSETETARLTDMAEEISAKRAEAAGAVPTKALKIFERVAENLDGEAMAPIETHGKKPPHEYVCGGCFMSLNAEHANALKVRDEVRTCNNCGRILYLAPQAEQSRA